MIIKIKNLSKKYQIDQAAARHRSLREDLMLLNPFAKKNRSTKEEIWPLKSLNLTIDRGESLGIVGSNGSGKSTLLKLLSRVTHPTTGTIELLGRVGALLEVGVGFHEELTGRDNIYLSGTILGMKRKEIAAHFDEIVSFSEVGDFLETPVKRYSSGMFLRLAFSVMAHLNSDILIIDEVLSVGDGKFQEKALNKMKAVVNENRTVIFVSHHLETIRKLCTRLIWLEKGVLMADGPTDQVLEAYTAFLSKKGNESA